MINLKFEQIIYSLYQVIFENFLFEPITLCFIAFFITLDLFLGRFKNVFFRLSISIDFFFSLINRFLSSIFASFILIFSPLVVEPIRDLATFTKNCPIVSFFLLLITLDFFYYWYHRSFHFYYILKKFHLVHHNIGTLTFFSGQRVHPIERIIEAFILTIPISFLAQSLSFNIFIVYLFLRIWPFVAHCNISMSFGFLDRFIVSPAYHKIHHAKEKEYATYNYSVVFSIWDWFFGSQLLPENVDRWHEIDLGIINMIPPENKIKGVATLMNQITSEILLKPYFKK
ncbi:MAG: sterol desaturase family protein [Oligoflexia bacterium]|nr:sterol desaturase family protein [Oligoflexia bacterium]